MVKKISFIILLLFIFNNNIYSDSVSGVIHKYGFYALGDNVSTLFYNPAGLFNLSSRYDEFVITTERRFTYNDFSIGKYITRFALLSSEYPSSINLGMGVNNDSFIIGIGGTLIDFLKYGINLKSMNLSGEKYFDSDIGCMLRFKFFPEQRYRKPEIVFGFTIKNLKNNLSNPLYYVPSLYIRPVEDIKITTGVNFDKNFNSNEYSVSMDINLVEQFYLMFGIQKYVIPIGIEWELTEILRKEVIFIAAEYNKDAKKFNDVIFSYRHRFDAFKLSKNVTGKRRKMIRNESEEDIESSIPPKIIREQRKILEKAKFYFAQEKLGLAERKFKEVIKLNNKSSVADEARDWLRKIKNIKRNLK